MQYLDVSPNAPVDLVYASAACRYRPVVHMSSMHCVLLFCSFSVVSGVVWHGPLSAGAKGTHEALEFYKRNIEVRAREVNQRMTQEVALHFSVFGISGQRVATPK